MDLEITPEPTEEERAAIAKALAEETAGSTHSPWFERVLTSFEQETA
jgi:hypothetical protein